MKLFIFTLSICLASSIFAQDSIRLSPQQIEALFLKQNLALVAERMNIDIADAQIAQAKLWENPELSVGDVNLWSSNSQREGEGEVIPPFWGKLGKNTQFSVELSQLISTANKKGKESGKEKKAKEIAIEDFEDLLRNMKTELRVIIYELIYLQEMQILLSEQKSSMEQLIDAFQKQVNVGNFAKTELLRLQSAKFGLDGQINENKIALNENLKNIKSLICASPLTEIWVESDANVTPNPNSLNITTLIVDMLQNRPDLKRDQLQIQYHEKSIDLEKSLRVPDLNLSVSYDRRGGVWRDFVGFGLSFSIPLWDRNQGNIKSAKFEKEQSQFESRQNIINAQHDAMEAYQNYKDAYAFHTELKSNDLLKELDNMYIAYGKNLLKKNVSMLEYIDFAETYLSNKELVLTTHKNMCIAFQNLQHTLATDL